MDPRYAEYYERELKHVREMGGEFARDFPAIAQRLALSSFECADPYVERLLESFAFLTARIQLKLDASFPQFTQHLLELLYPGFLSPTPSMAVVQMQPTPREGELARGVAVPRGTSLRSRLGQNQTACEYRTAHEVRLYPLELVSADYRALPNEDRNLSSLQLPPAQAALKLVLRCTGGRKFDQLRLESLPIFLRGRDLAPRLYEHLISAATGMVVRCATTREVLHVSPRRTTSALGLEDENAVLPCGTQAFQGHRLLQEYFAFPERFLFVSLNELAPGCARCHGDTLEIQLLFDKVDRRLEGVIKESHIALFCTPVVNLFPRKSDRVALSDGDYEHHVVPDRARPGDFEVHTVTRVVGHGLPGTREQEFLPMYETAGGGTGDTAHFAVRRQQKLVSSQEGHGHARSLYAPSDTFLSLVDGQHGPYRRELRQLAVDTLCTNRMLPLTMAVGRGDTDFHDQSGAPIEAVRCIAGPTMPRHSLLQGKLAWNLISHLGLDYMALLREGAEHHSVRDLLSIYAGATESNESAKQIAGVLGVTAQNVVRPLPFPGPLTFGRGTELTLTCDEGAFEGTGVFVLGSVLERFFAKYASINSFTQTVLRTSQRGEVMRWPTTAGRRNIL